MRWPFGPLETQRRFAPAFCPYKECTQHTLERADRFRYEHHGAYTGHAGRKIPRYRCLACRRCFSKQSFAFSLYLKRPELCTRIAAGLVAGQAHRQIARCLGCAPSTVTRMAARLGRHGLLLQARCLHEIGTIGEPVTLDHFETFELTQDYPFGVATAVGARSWFVLALDPAPHGRGGRVTPFQKARLLARPRRDDRGGYAASCRRVLDVLLPLSHRKRLEIVTDDHADYRRAFRGPQRSGRVLHTIHPNPERGPKGSPRSRAARARDRALFASDLLHGLLRHSMAAHRRETIAFGRRLNAIMERLALAACWRNLVKGVSERKPDATTPAMRLGLTSAPWSWRRVLAKRLFPGREPVPESWMTIYRREWINPALPSNRRHTLRNAF